MASLLIFKKSSSAIQHPFLLSYVSGHQFSVGLAPYIWLTGEV
jgi:hypothetical protein